MKLTLLVTLLSLGLSAGACNRDGNEGSSRAAITGDGGRPDADFNLPPGLDAGSNRASYGGPLPFTPGNDMAFIDWALPHLGRGVAMANNVIDRGQRMEVKLFATRVRQEEMDAMNQLMGARTAIAGSAEAPPPPRDPAAEEVMSQIMNASGASLEDLYLMHLLGHHGLEIEIVLRALPNLESMTVRGLAQHMLETDADEIGEVQELRHMH
jgi:uncharacterized protein (DUF305 family)